MVSDTGTAKVTLREVQACMKRGALEQAEKLCERFAAQSPDSWLPDIIRAQIASKSGKTDAIEHHIAAAAHKGAPAVRLASLRYWTARTEAARLSTAKTLCELEPDKALWPKAVVTGYMKLRDFDAALEALGSVYRDHPEAEIDFRVLNWLVHQLPEDTLPERLDGLVEKHPKAADPRLLRSLLRSRSLQLEGALDDLDVALRLRPDLRLASLSLNDLKYAVAHTPDGLSRVQGLRSRHPDNLSLLSLLMQIYDELGETDNVLSTIDAFRGRLTADNMTRLIAYHDPRTAKLILADDTEARKLDFLTLVDHGRFDLALPKSPSDTHRRFYERAQKLQRTSDGEISRFGDHGDVTLFGPDRPNGIVLSFGGWGDWPGTPPAVLDRFLSQLGLTQVYLRDRRRILYLNGVGGLGDDLDSTIKALKSFLAEKAPDKPLFTLGNSGGSFGAMIYAEALGARSSLVFCPVANIDWRHEKASLDRRASILVKRLNSLPNIDRFKLATVLDRMPRDYTVTAYASRGSRVHSLHLEDMSDIAAVRPMWLEGDQAPAFLLAAERYGMVQVLKDAFSL